ncbi:hypothetical protein GTH52_06955 [Clostridium tyrobutyricum]|uniref:Uncharacterized protein n=1 Tax=Clostridium tyrobutyricum DIVETGP TaxID=1408889 RepID=W6N5A5_CLOTY|nr:hypothetical protein [Clostridium tyrobutyricum]AND84294.1 hypothetical protein CTK_C10330 [Clostridium tyrobutyricum]AND84378.1 hypothetical protein CTK_C11170 [Clostridium tyrobutyricum]ANP69005.1 hypothetical protein BA182_04750 [Clostridium tyrobutyricum]MBV4435389.1 hypothetical protein [Clostridium tyrobutyricum]QNB66645.1 hypothetical protein GTH52_06955 [Clostridium tyrobutyricum]
MMVKGSCQKQDLMQTIHDAILSPGSNWTEISSNKTNDHLYSGAMSDGWVFKSIPIGAKQQSIFMTLKSLDLSLSTGVSGALFAWLSDNYVPNATDGQNGTHTNRSYYCNIWCFDLYNKIPTTMFDYFIDIEDHRILIVIQQTNTGTVTYPHFLYVGYPEPSTNLEGLYYTNQLILGDILGRPSSWGTSSSCCYWHKNSLGHYNAHALSECNLNNLNPTPIGAYLLSPVYVTGDGCGAGDPGPLGVLSGLYCMPNTSIVNGDIVTVGSDTYQVFIMGGYSVNGTTLIGIYGYYRDSIAPAAVAIKINN